MTEDGGRVLVVDHEPGVAELQLRYLRRAGFEVHVELDPPRAPATAAQFGPDAVVLDLTATGTGPPAEFFRRVVDAAWPGLPGAAPLVCVLAEGAEPPVGAAYALTRPFAPRVLVAAVAEALRGRDDPLGDALRVGGVELDPRTRTVRVLGRPAALTATEFELLAFLLASPGRVFSREQLLEAAWGTADGTGARTVDVHIAQLRAKLGDGSPIRTVRGVGYAADH